MIFLIIELKIMKYIKICLSIKALIKLIKLLLRLINHTVNQYDLIILK